MQYSYTCPSGDCNFSVKIIAQNYDWAVEKIVEVSSIHGEHVHPNELPMTLQQIKNVVRSCIKEQ